MCGIVGFIGKATLPTVNYFEWALRTDQIRGTHGTGVIIGTQDGGVFSDKAPFDANEYIQVGGDMPALGDLFAVGHNRHATVGNHTTPNTHPFEFGHIVGVHNGSLTTYKSLCPAGTEHEVDSAYIFDALSRTDDAKEVLEKIDGAFALVWYDAKKKRVFFARNSQRPLGMRKTAAGNIIFASELGMLQWLAGRSSQRVVGEDLELPVGELWSIDPAAANPAKSIEITKFTPKTYHCGWSGYSGYGSYYSGRQFSLPRKKKHQNANKKLSVPPKPDTTGRLVYDESGTEVYAEIITKSKPYTQGNLAKLDCRVVHPQHLRGHDIVAHSVPASLMGQDFIKGYIASSFCKDIPPKQRRKVHPNNLYKHHIFLSSTVRPAVPKKK